MATAGSRVVTAERAERRGGTSGNLPLQHIEGMRHVGIDADLRFGALRRSLRTPRFRRFPLRWAGVNRGPRGVARRKAGNLQGQHIA